MPRLVIPGRLPGLNDAFAAARAYGRNPKANPEARLRKQYEGQIILIAKGQLKRWRAHGKVRLRYTFYEKNRCRDMDNVAGYAHKLIQDALINARRRWYQVTFDCGIKECFFVDVEPTPLIKDAKLHYKGM